MRDGRQAGARLPPGTVPPRPASLSRELDVRRGKKACACANGGYLAGSRK
jgi:hypothetical protein